MRRIVCLFGCVLLMSLVGCTAWHAPKWSWDDFDFGLMDDEKDKKSADAEPESAQGRTELIGHFAAITGNNVLTLRGYGLVTMLDNTGEDPPPSFYRTQLVEDMRRRGVTEPNAILASPTTALVLLTAYLPADIQKGDPFDVEVYLPENSEATSLAGGWLMETRLTEKAVVPGQGILDGHDFGIAQGPILISTGEGDKASLAGVLKRGKVLAGGRALKERNLGMYIRSDYRSVRNSKRIADVIGRRFHSHDQYGQKRPMAIAKDDQYVELRVHPRYKDNYPRYMQVIRSIAFRENPVQQRERMERLKDKQQYPETAARAAIELEAMGPEAVPALKAGLKSPLREVQFYAAEALAYLGDPAGAQVLYEAARDERAFRVYALAALTALDDATSFEHLRLLMDEQSAETRYGAFRALWTLDKDDPYIAGERLNDQFHFHVIDSKAEPLIHMTRNRIAEIVVFGRDQQFKTPLTLTAGTKINVNAPAGSEIVTVSRFEIGEPDQRKVVSRNVAEVIQAVAELGGSYPDVAQMLAQAQRQFNAPGKIEIDSLPQAGRIYYRPNDGTGPSRKREATVGKPGLMPNLYPAVREAKAGGEKVEEPKADAEKGPVDEPAEDEALDEEPVESVTDTKPKRSWPGFSKAKADTADAPKPAKPAKASAEKTAKANAVAAEESEEPASEPLSPPSQESAPRKSRLPQKLFGLPGGQKEPEAEE